MVLSFLLPLQLIVLAQRRVSAMKIKAMIETVLTSVMQVSKIAWEDNIAVLKCSFSKLFYVENLHLMECCLVCPPLKWGFILMPCVPNWAQTCHEEPSIVHPYSVNVASGALAVGFTWLRNQLYGSVMM